MTDSTLGHGVCEPRAASRERARKPRQTAIFPAIALLALACSSSTPPPAAPSTDIAATARRSVAADRQKVALTVYNSNFALVREERRLSLGTGRVALAYEDVSAHVQPETVHLRSLDAPDGLSVLEQNYRYDLLTPQTLLEKYVGQHLKVARYNEKLGSEEIKDAELLAMQNGPVLRIDGQVVTGDVGRFIFPELPASLLARPTLVWLLDSARAEQQVELSYLTSNLSWSADYVLVLDPSDTKGDLSGWVTLDNQSGTSFATAQLSLVAGDVQRVQPPPPPAPPPMPIMEEAAEDSAAGNGFRQEALFEYHLYTLQRPADVLDKEQKQVSLLEAHGIDVKKKLVFQGNEYGYNQLWRDETKNQKVSAFVVFDNSEQKGLGMPLPAGIVRVYKADSGGAQQFVGEDRIEHTPRDEPIEIKLGESFDVVGDRRQTSYKALGKCSGESAWQVELRNHKDAGERVEVKETASGDYQVVESSHPVVRPDAKSFAFEVDVPARGAVKVTYRVRVRWC
ncbi:MAG TPA: DUF4139 domain-containing protein [Polyangiaceae bacterium]|nr:DUF4139 domain-containing protein [Polyangiaceae bacterium]